MSMRHTPARHTSTAMHTTCIRDHHNDVLSLLCACLPVVSFDNKLSHTVLLQVLELGVAKDS
jgi:hypothetical protein